jgi:hypothetical protein
MKPTKLSPTVSNSSTLPEPLPEMCISPLLKVFTVKCHYFDLDNTTFQSKTFFLLSHWTDLAFSKIPKHVIKTQKISRENICQSYPQSFKLFYSVQRSGNGSAEMFLI